MIRDIMDTHTHTLASGHAYSTIKENAEAAAKKGLELLCLTEHGPKIPGGPHDFYFDNMRVIDRSAYAVPVLMGCEMNVIATDGTVDLGMKGQKRLDIGLASLHIPCFAPKSRLENTEALINAMDNPRVNIIAHPDDARFEIDYEALVQAAKEKGVLIELNNGSLNPESSRENGYFNNKNFILPLCVKYGASIVMGSDAHIDLDVGNHDIAIALLEEIAFPEELIVNTDVKKLEKYLHRGE